MDRPGHGLIHGDNLEEFLRTGAGVIAVTVGVVRELEKPIVQLRRFKSHNTLTKLPRNLHQRRLLPLLLLDH